MNQDTEGLPALNVGAPWTPPDLDAGPPTSRIQKKKKFKEPPQRTWWHSDLSYSFQNDYF